MGILEEEVGKNLDVTILWSYPTIEKLADYLAKETIVDERKTVEVDEKKDSGNFADSVEDLTEEEAEELLLKKLGIK